MSLIKKDLPSLRGAAHKLKPVVMLGKAGLTEPVLVEINTALDFHELIKVKVAGEDRDERRALIAAIAEKTNALLVQVIGRIAVLYRAVPKPPVAKPARPTAKSKSKPNKPKFKPDAIPLRRTVKEKPQRRVGRPTSR